ncbi:MAG: helix-turn-helix domain-containing protein [Thermomicrobiales bacterium]
MTSPGRSERDDQLLTVADVAGHIGAHEQTVRGWILAGELTASKFGTRIGYRIRRGDYDEFLRRRQLSGAIARQLLTMGSLAGGARELDVAT